MRLKDKVVIITGSTTGIGKAIAIKCAAEGARLVITGLEKESGEEVIKEIGKENSALYIEDITKDGAPQKLVDFAVKTYGKLDAVVNNAAWVVSSDIHTTQPELLRQVFEINTVAPFILIQSALKQLKMNKGCILNIGSINAYSGEPDLLPYSISKGALMTMTQNLGDTLFREEGIRVNQINPGWVLTENETKRKREHGFADEWYKELPAIYAPSKRLLQSSEIAAAAVYWLADESGPVSGQIHNIEQYPATGRNLSKSFVGILALLLFLFNYSYSQEKTSPDSTKKINTAKRIVPKAKLIRGPYLQVATSTSMTIRWRTDAFARSRVSYGTTLNKLDKTIVDSSIKTEHIIKIEGLQPRTKYYYSIGGVKDTMQGDSNNYFYTLASPGEKNLYRIGMFGDCGTNAIHQWRVKDEFIKYLGKNDLDAWLLLGDNAYPNGEDAQYGENFFEVYKNDLLKKYPLFPTPGNHDYHDVEYSIKYAQQSHEIAYYKIFSMPTNGEAGGFPSNNKAYYSFDIGNIHFLSLDSYGYEENSSRLYDTLASQVQWIKKDLAANKNKDWVIAYWHHPPFTMGSHNSDKEAELIKIRENFIRILEREGVDLVVCGHSHLYERSKLINGHYGMENTFNDQQHSVSNSSALYDGSDNSCPYIKSTGNNKGTVYVVSGSAGQLSSRIQPGYPHDAMVYSNPKIAGASLLTVEGNRLDMKWITEFGEVADSFTMMKDVNKKTELKIKKGQRVNLTASFTGNYKWFPGNQQTRTISVAPKKGKTTYSVRDEHNCIQDIFEIEVLK